MLNLQKSQYASRYYINVAVWLLAAGPADAPKPSHCHIQTRLEKLVPVARAERMARLLDLDVPFDGEDRRAELLAVLRACLLPVIAATSTLEGLRSGEGQRFVNASLIDGDGLRLLSFAK